MDLTMRELTVSSPTFLVFSMDKYTPSGCHRRDTPARPVLIVGWPNDNSDGSSGGGGQGRDDGERWW
jgi:hypothetical protein